MHRGYTYVDKPIRSSYREAKQSKLPRKEGMPFMLFRRGMGRSPHSKRLGGAGGWWLVLDGGTESRQWEVIIGAQLETNRQSV